MHHKKLKISLATLFLLFIFIQLFQYKQYLDIKLDLYSSYGTMTTEKVQKIFLQPQQAQASYKAIIAIPGLTATIDKCSFLQLPCLHRNFITVPIQGAANPTTHSIVFHIPEYHRWLYKLSNFNYSLPKSDPKNNAPSVMEGQLVIQTPFTYGGGNILQQAISIGTAYEGLLGTLSFSKQGYETQQHINADLINNGQPAPYQFARHHHYFGYMQNSGIRQIDNVQSSDHNAELKHRIPNVDEVYEARKYTAQLDQLHYENYVIRAKLKNVSTCKEYPSFEYNIFYINGKLVHYESTQTDQTNCKTHYINLSRFENGSIDTFGHSIYNNKSNQMHYAEWHYLCPIKRYSALGQCVLAKPNDQEIQSIEADIHRIVKWFEPV